MSLVEILFWLSVAILVYCYVGYGILLFLLNQLKLIFLPSRKPLDFDLLPVTLIVTAYNEEGILLQKIKNTLQIDYPSDHFKIIFIIDGSSDGSENIIRQYDSITLLSQPRREGKLAAIRRAMRFVQTPVVVFSDANSMLNPGCMRAIVSHYSNEKVGGVAGEKKILNNHSSLVGQAEGFYWKYESFMKQQDANFNTVVGAAGELFSIRTELFYSLEDHLILDDFIISMQVCLNGFKIEYEPLAYAIEAPSISLADEEKRKIRIAAGAYQSIYYSKQCLNIIKYPLLSIQYFSRRLLRWIACPALIMLVLLTNLWLVAHQQGAIFNSFLLAQGIFYLLVVAGRIFVAAGWRMGILNIPFYFIFMNLCLVKGFLNYIQGRQTVLWEKSMREAIE